MVKVLIVATSTTPDHASEDVDAGLRHRVDYLSLADRLSARYLDYNSVGGNSRLMDRIEARLRLDFRLARCAETVARRERVDVVFSMSERVGIPLAYQLPRVTHHIVNVHHLLSPRKVRLLRLARIPSRWSAVLSYSEVEAAAIQRVFGLSPEQSLWLPDKVDIRFWTPSSENGQPRLVVRGEPVFSIGLSYRDYPTLLRAMNLLPDVRAGIHVGSAWVSGSGGVEGELVPDNVTLSTAPLAALQVRERYRASRVVVIPITPTTLWNAGSSAALEAQAVGKPVVATRTPGMSSYVLDGETGILIDPGDAGEMARAINWLLDNPDRAAAMGRRARSWVESRFALDTWIDEMATRLVQPASVTSSAHVATGQNAPQRT